MGGWQKCEPLMREPTRILSVRLGMHEKSMCTPGLSKSLLRIASRGPAVSMSQGSWLKPGYS